MLNTINLIIYMILFNLPFMILLFYPFMDKLKISTKKLSLIFVSFITIKIIYFFMTLNNNLENVVFRDASRTFFLIVILCIAFFCIRASFYKITFVFFFLIQYTSLIFACAQILELEFFNEFSNLYPVLISNIILVIELILSYPILIKIINKLIIPTLSIKSSVIWKCICIFSFMLFIIDVLFAFIYYSNIINNFSYIIVRFCILSLFLSVCTIFFKALNQVEYNLRLEKHSLYISNQLSLQKEQYTNLYKYIDEIKSAKHDFRHHLALMQAYIESNDRDLLKKYIDEYNLKISLDSEIMISSNPTIDALSRHYIKIMESESIDFDIKINLPLELSIVDTDLCIVFGNCIENAIEACKNKDIKKPYIRIRCNLHNDMMILTIDNSFKHNLVERNNTFLSSKRSYSQEGIGLSSIREICNKYNGIAKFTYSDNEFNTSIMMNNKLSGI